MKKQIIIWSSLLCLLLSACGKAAPQAVSERAVTFTDDLGREVTVDHPQRVAALLGSFAQIWQLAGGQVAATANDAWEDLGLDLPEDTVNLGGKENLSLELLLSAEPDLILASTNTRQNVEWRDMLEATGIPVAYFEVAEFEDYLRMLKICTDITGNPDRYQSYGVEVRTQIGQVLERSRTRLEASPAPTVLSLTASASFVKAKNSEGNVLGTMLKALGCINIADSDSMLLEELSMEHILACDPDHIFIVQRGDDTEGMRAYVSSYLMEHPAWNKLTAVKAGNVHFMEKELYSLKPNQRWGEAYEKLEDLLSHE